MPPVTYSLRPFNALCDDQCSARATVELLEDDGNGRKTVKAKLCARHGMKRLKEASARR